MDETGAGWDPGYERVWGKNCDSILGLDAGLDEGIGEVLHPLCPGGQQSEQNTRNMNNRRKPDGISVVCRVLHIRVGDGDVVRIYQSTTKQKRQRVLSRND